jgi:hypothetical protein
LKTVVNGFAKQPAAVVMGPCVRRGDEGSDAAKMIRNQNHNPKIASIVIPTMQLDHLE